MGKVVALLLVVLSLLGGAAAGHMLRPAGDAEAEAAPPPEPEGPPEAVQLREPFIVPILRHGRVDAHMVLQLGIESLTIPRADLLVQEPRLRDALNRTLYLHGSLGGFDGDFTSGPQMDRLRERMDEAVAEMLEDPAARVLLIGLTRQGV